MKNIKTINLNGENYNVGFSTNDFTDELKKKLERVADNYTEYSYSNGVLSISTKLNSFSSNVPSNPNTNPERISISTSVNDNLMGFVTGAGTYDKGESVTLLAMANDGYRFLCWGDEVTDNPRTIIANLDGVTYSAIFEEEDTSEKVTIKTQTNDSRMGNVTGSGTYNIGERVTLIAMAKDGFRFDSWDDGETDNPRTITVNENKVNYVATFVPEFDEMFTLTVTSNDESMGYVLGSGEYYKGEYATLKATANYGYRFVQWNDGNTQQTREIEVKSDKQYVATFAEELINISTSVNDSSLGSVTGAGAYNKGESVTLVAMPNEGCKFVCWGDEVTDNPRTIIANVNGVTYSAIFEWE